MSLTRRLFTIQEAQALVSWLQETFEAIAPLLERAGQLRDQIEALLHRTQHNGGGDVDAQLADARRASKETTSRIEQQVQQVQERDILVKSLEQGLVDFPSLRDAREVYLCWRMGRYLQKVCKQSGGVPSL